MKIDEMYWAFYRWFRDRCFHPIYYRIFGHKFHIIKTQLPPSPWYDVDARMLYGMMNMAKWFVENDMLHRNYDEWKKEIRENKEGLSEEENKNYIESIEHQEKKDNEIIAIVNWWRDYERRRKEIDIALTEWHDYHKKFQKSDEMFFLNSRNNMNDQEKAFADKLHEKIDELEIKLDNEEEEYLTRLVKIRKYMWS